MKAFKICQEPQNITSKQPQDTSLLLNALVCFSKCSNNCICPLMPCDQRQKGPSSRAHSAINDEAGSSIPRDRHHLLDIFSRPNTTHTYRVRCSSSSHNPAYTHGILFKDQRWYVWPISIFPVGHSVPSFLHSVGQHWAGAARQSLCGHRSEIQLDQL